MLICCGVFMVHFMFCFFGFMTSFCTKELVFNDFLLSCGDFSHLTEKKELQSQ